MQNGAKAAKVGGVLNITAFTTRRWTACAFAALIIVAAGGLGCGKSSGDPVAEAEAAYAGCLEGTADPLECQAFDKGRAAGAEAGRLQGERWARQRTEDGYQLRKVASLALVAVGMWIAGSLLAALWAARRRGGSPTGYAAHVLEVLEREADRVRALAKSGDPMVAQLVERVRGPLAETERQARQIGQLCRSLEEAEAEGEGPADAAARAQRESYYRKLDQLVGRVERLRAQIGLWQERLATEERDALDDEVRHAIADLNAAMEELA